MTGRNRRNFSPEFRLEAAQLVLDQRYTVAAAATAMNVGKSTMDKWVRQLREEQAGISPIASPMTPEQIISVFACCTIHPGDIAILSIMSRVSTCVLCPGYSPLINPLPSAGILRSESLPVLSPTAADRDERQKPHE